MNAFHAVLRTARAARKVPQEALGELSSRTYVSALERGLKSPTLKKVEQISQMLDFSPLSLLVLSYARTFKRSDIQEAIEIAERDIEKIIRGVKIEPASDLDTDSHD